MLEQNGCHFADNISITFCKISMKFVLYIPLNYMPTLRQVMACCWTNSEQAINHYLMTQFIDKYMAQWISEQAKSNHLRDKFKFIIVLME